MSFSYALDYSWSHPWPRAPKVLHEEHRMKALHRYRILGTAKEEKYNSICDMARSELKVPISGVSFLSSDKQWFKASHGLTQPSIPRDVAFCAHTIISSEALVVLNTLKDERFRNNPLVTRASSIRFYAGIPITSSDGYRIGSVFVVDTRPRQSIDVESLKRLGRLVESCLEHSMVARVLNEYPAEEQPDVEQPTKQVGKKSSVLQMESPTHSSSAKQSKSHVETQSPTKLQTSKLDIITPTTMQPKEVESNYDGREVLPQKLIAADALPAPVPATVPTSDSEALSEPVPMSELGTIPNLQAGFKSPSSIKPIPTTTAALRRDITTEGTNPPEKAAYSSTKFIRIAKHSNPTPSVPQKLSDPQSSARRTKDSSWIAPTPTISSTLLVDTKDSHLVEGMPSTLPTLPSTALVSANDSSRFQVVASNHLALDVRDELSTHEGSMVENPNIRNMLFTLLARTTDTQRRLVTQQAVMFDTLEDHSGRILELTNKLSSLETMIDRL